MATIKQDLIEQSKAFIGKLDRGYSEIFLQDPELFLNTLANDINSTGDQELVNEFGSDLCRIALLLSPSLDKYLVLPSGELIENQF